MVRPLRKLLRGSTISMGLRVAGVAFSYLAHALLSRTMGLHDYGLYVILIGWVLVLGVPARLGFDASVLRYGTIYRDDENWPALRGLALVASFAVCGAALVISFGVVGVGLHSGVSLGKLLWSAALLVAISLLGLYSVFILSAGSVFGSQFYDQVLRPALIILGIAALSGFARSNLDLATAIAISAVAAWASLAGLAIHLRKRLRSCLHVTSDFSAARTWLGVSFPLLLIAGMQELLNQMQVILLGVWADARNAGLFAAAWRLASLISFGLVALAAVAGPMIASAYNRKDFRELGKLSSLAARVALAFALPTAMLMIVGGRLLLGVFGAEFRAAYLTLLVLVGGAVVNAFTGVVAYLLTLTGRQRHALIILSATLVANVGLNFLLIPRWGALGGAMASAMSTILWNMTMLAYVWRIMRIDASALGIRSRQVPTCDDRR